MPSEAEVLTLPEIEARVKRWRVSSPLSYKLTKGVAGAMVECRLKEALLVARYSGVSLAEVFRKMDKGLTPVEAGARK